MDIDTASPPVSPRVVAAILIIQKMSVTSGTLLKFFSIEFLASGSVMSFPASSDDALPDGKFPKGRGLSPRRAAQRAHAAGAAYLICLRRMGTLSMRRALPSQ